MTRNQKFISGVIICAGALLFGAYFFINQTPFPSASSISNKPELVANYQKVVAAYKQEKKEPENPQWYVDGGLELKTIADATGDERWYRAALATYERGIIGTNNRNTLLINNAAVICEKLGNYEQAKKYYEQAIEIAPGETMFYVNLVRIMRIYLNAAPNDILAIYDKGVERIVGGAQLYVDRAQYLKTIGRYDDSLADWKMLYDAKVINDAEYQAAITEINAARAAEKK